MTTPTNVTKILKQIKKIKKTPSKKNKFINEQVNLTFFVNHKVLYNKNGKEIIQHLKEGQKSNFWLASILTK